MNLINPHEFQFTHHYHQKVNENIQEIVEIIEITAIIQSLFRNKRFALNEMFQRNASKLAIFYV